MRNIRNSFAHKIRSLLPNNQLGDLWISLLSYRGESLAFGPEYCERGGGATFITGCLAPGNLSRFTKMYHPVTVAVVNSPRNRCSRDTPPPARKFTRDVRFAGRVALISRNRGFRGARARSRLEPRSLMACFQRSYIASPRVYSGLTTPGRLLNGYQCATWILTIHGEFFVKHGGSLALLSRVHLYSFILYTCSLLFFSFYLNILCFLIFLYFNSPFSTPFFNTRTLLVQDIICQQPG